MRGEAGIVDEHVDRPERARHHGEGLADRRLVADVGDRRLDRDAVARQFVGEGLDAIAPVDRARSSPPRREVAAEAWPMPPAAPVIATTLPLNIMPFMSL